MGDTRQPLPLLPWTTALQGSAFSHTHRYGGCTVLAFHGDIDLVAAPVIRPHLDAATADLLPRVVLDLRAATFIDAAALGLLCRARARVRQRGGRLALVCTCPWHRRILAATALTRALNCTTTLDHACAAVLMGEPGSPNAA
jgi:anti-sigma B factor antagonist